MRCNNHNTYPLTLSSWPSVTNGGDVSVATEQGTQWVEYGNSNAGFTLPSFVTTKNVGCPAWTWEVSASNTGSGGVTTGHGLNPTALNIGGNKVFAPANTALHQAYSNLYFRIAARNDNSGIGSYTWFGPYTLNVGCFTGQVLYTDSGSFVTNVAIA